MKSMMMNLQKLTLNSNQQLRAIMASAWTSFLVPASAGCIRAAQISGARYSELVAKGGQQAKELGPPHVHKFATFLEGLVAEAEAEHKEVLKALVAKLADCELE
jgi:hypothetical protein